MLVAGRAGTEVRLGEAQNIKYNRFANKGKVTNSGFELTQVISLRLPAQCNVPERVSDFGLLKEK